MKRQAKLTGSSKRMSWVDYARGLAIILVLYRHIVVGLEFSGIPIPAAVFNIQESTLNFRMPVFFILSGCFLFLSLEKYDRGNVFLKKAKTLLHPYLLWTFILVTFQIIFSNVTNASRTTFDYLYIILQPRELDHMWYLLALFNTSAIFIALWGWMKNRPLLHFLLAIALHYLSFLLKDVSLLSDPFYHYVFLLTGAYIPKYLVWLQEKKNGFLAKMLLVITPFFIVGQYFWLSYREEQVSLAIPFLVIIFIAFLFFYCICRILQNAGVALWLETIGKHSLYIYILHLYVIAAFRVFCVRVLGVDNLFVLIGGSLVLGILLPIVAYKLANRMNLWYLFSLSKPVKVKAVHGS